MVLLGRSPIGERAVEHLRDAEKPTLSLSIPERSMSAEHARPERFLEGWVIEDCNSKNGTFVNGRQIEHVELKDGDVIEMGQTFLDDARELVRANFPWGCAGRDMPRPARQPSGSRDLDRDRVIGNA